MTINITKKDFFKGIGILMLFTYWGQLIIQFAVAERYGLVLATIFAPFVTIPTQVFSLLFVDFWGGLFDTLFLGIGFYFIYQ